MTDEKLTNLAMIFIESETAKTLDMTVDKNICISENKQNNICISENLEKGIVLAWNIANAQVYLLYILCWCCRKCFYKHLLK